MPTAAKLVSALIYALVGWSASLAYNSALPEGISMSTLPPVMAGLGLLLGWFSMGPVAGRGWRESMAYGLRTSFLIGFLAMFGFAMDQMLRKASHRMYRADPVAALLDVPDLMYQYGKYMFTTDVMVSLLVGGLLGGVIVEYVARRWS